LLNLSSIVEAILSEYALPWQGIHGISHWARVMENGLQLARETGADPEVVQLFALFHDSRRVNESLDDGHGKRGAELAAIFRGGLFTLSNAQFELLYEACVSHTDGRTEGEVTIQTCWDSDRLDLGRVAICPNPEKLCTPTAKRPDILRWADRRACDNFLPEVVHQHWKIDFKKLANE
jgi:uncharacterized protein